MRKLIYFVLAFLAASVVFVAFAQDAVVPAPISGILAILGPLFEGFIKQYPVIGIVVFWIGAVRIVMKPVMAVALAIVQLTNTKSDDEWLAKLKTKKWYKTVCFILDWFLSVKLPKEEK